MEDVRRVILQLWPALVVIALVPLAFLKTTADTVGVWIEAETYTHGFLVLPIALWLVWQARAEVIRVVVQPDYLALPFLIASIFGWLIAELASVQVVASFGLVTTMISGCWLVLGRQASMKLAFPLLFLLFAVPAGEALVPPMMEFTAWFTVGMLRLTGVPVYQDGLSFSIPTGNWTVVEACSGVRYIIASVVLGVLFAYLNYRSRWRQAAFILISALVPVIANGFRAYGIVMLGHLSDMTLAVGFDHLIYGWLFFGVVMLILFSIGAIWREDTGMGDAIADDAEHAREIQQTSFASQRLPLALLLAAVVSGVLLLQGVKNLQATGRSNLLAPTVAGYQQQAMPDWGWSPIAKNRTARLASLYRRAGEPPVALIIDHYANQTQGEEVINKSNRVGAGSTGAGLREQLYIGSGLTDGPSSMYAAVLAAPRQRLRAWRWYRVAGRDTASQYVAKFYEVLGKLIDRRTEASIVVVATPTSDDEPVSQADARLRAFVEQAMPAIRQAVDPQ